MALILEQNLITIYFFYGLAFFAMGLALIVESGRSSEFPFAMAMAPLAAFGIIHGFHEWLEMFQLLNQAGVTTVPDWLLNDSIRLTMLVVSFMLLAIFGVRLVYVNHNPGSDGRLPAYAVAAALLIVWLISVIVARRVYDLEGSGLAAAADVLGRYVLAVPGALLAAWAILLEQRTFSARGMPAFGRALLGAAVALIIYGTIGQMLAKTSVVFPSNVLNGELFRSLTGMPVQLLRTLCAVTMTLFIVRALRAFDLETQQKLTAARHVEETAQRAIVTERQNVEQLNQELREAVRNLSSLYGFTQSLAKTLDSRAMLQDALIQFVSSEPHIDASIVFLRDREESLPHVAAMTQCPVDREMHEVMFEHALRVGEQVIATGQPAVWTGTGVVDITTAQQLGFIEKTASSAAPAGGRTLGVPLSMRGQLAGSLVICTTPEQPPFSSREFSLISTAAEQLSIALQNAALYREIQERDKMRGELLHQVVSAQEMERQRIARELHDGTGQTLTALGLGLAAISGRIHALDTGSATQMDGLKELCTSAMIELRDVISDLRPSVLDDLGLVPALKGQVQAFSERSGVRADLDISGHTRRLSPDLETIVFRIVQEALTNIYKHAEALSVLVTLVFEPENLHLIIRDDGRGFDTRDVLGAATGNQKAWGVLGMQERVALAGGSWEIVSAPGQGTIIEIDIPLQETQEVLAYGQD